MTQMGCADVTQSMYEIPANDRHVHIPRKMFFLVTRQTESLLLKEAKDLAMQLQLGHCHLACTLQRTQS